jgi:hypothetical protein
MVIGRGIWVDVSTFVFCFLTSYEHGEFLLLMAFIVFVVFLWVSFVWCAFAMWWFLLVINQA